MNTMFERTQTLYNKITKHKPMWNPSNWLFWNCFRSTSDPHLNVFPPIYNCIYCYYSITNSNDSRLHICTLLLDYIFNIHTFITFVNKLSSFTSIRYSTYALYILSKYIHNTLNIFALFKHRNTIDVCIFWLKNVDQNVGNITWHDFTCKIHSSVAEL